MRNSFAKIKSMPLDTNEALREKQIEENYTSYMAVYTDVASKRKTGLTITLEQSNQFATIGASLTNKLKNAVLNEKSVIATNTADYKIVSDSSGRSFIIVSIISVLLLLSISITFVYELELLLKEMTNTIDVIASGDFTVEIDTTSNTEFGNMNKKLDNMRFSVAGLLSNITTVAGTVGE